MNIAIIGGSGFIGSYLVDSLNSLGLNYTIFDLVKPKFNINKWQYCDITDITTLLNFLEGFTHIINLAAEHKDDVYPHSLYYKVNVEGAKNICNVANQLGINNIIFTSSVAVYGFVENETDETGALNPFNHYGMSKLQAEKVYDTWQLNNSESSLTIIRPTVVFGIGNRGNVYNLFRQISSGKFLMVGSGDNKKSMAYVENVVAFIVFSLQFGEGRRVFNYVDKPDYTMNELVKLISDTLSQKTTSLKLPYQLGLAFGYAFDLLSKVTKRKFSVSSIRIKKFCATTQFKSSYLPNINFTTPVELQNAIKKTIENDFKS